MDAQTVVDVLRVRGSSRTAATDQAAAEEPLEVRLHTRPFAVIMRTPGADQALAAGFLLSERVFDSFDDLGAIEHCRDEAAAAGNVVNVTLTGRAAANLERVMADRRMVTANASCGMCGRLTIDTVTNGLEPVASTVRVSSDTLASLPDKLRLTQAGFDATGGLHASGLFDVSGTLVAMAEDVGRHNAVDKVVGSMLLREALPLHEHVLCVSGRTSFEIVLKAFVAGIPIVASVSAPSSLAIDLAHTAGITLAGFVRGGGFNVYSGAARIV